MLHVGVSAATVSCIGYVTDAFGDGASDAIALVVYVE